MSTGYQIKDQEALHYLTMQVVDWIDIFTRKAYRDLVLESISYCRQNKGLQVFGYVIMSNHVHLICNSPDGKLSDTIRDLKKFTSRKLIEVIQTGNESRKEWMLDRLGFTGRKNSRNQDFQVWTHENHAIVLYSNPFIHEKLTYLHNNPVRAGIVERPEEYLYSSARNYADMPGPLEIILLSLPLLSR